MRNGEVRCPACGARVVSSRKDASDDRLQSNPGAGRPVAKIGRATQRQTDEGDAVPIRKESGFPVALLIVGVVGLAFLGLLAIGGGIAAYLFFSSPPAVSPPVAAAPPEAAAAPGPDAQVPVAVPNPQPGPANPPQAPPPKPAIQPVPQGGGAVPGGALPLKELKAASVYIKARMATLAASGSGFVIRAQGDTVYVATNHHVVTPPKDAGSPLIDPFMPFGPRSPVCRRRSVRVFRVCRSAHACPACHATGFLGVYPSGRRPSNSRLSATAARSANSPSRP
jgi:hypothetical protein